MPLATYQLLHMIGIFIVLTGMGGLWVLSATPYSGNHDKIRKRLMGFHGAAMLLILFGGFGSLARLGITGSWPLWIWLKLAIWLALGAYPVLLKRAKSASAGLLALIPLLAAIAAWAVKYKIGSGL